MRIRRTHSITVAVALAVGSLASCSRDDRADEELRAAMRATERLPHRFVYQEQAGAREFHIRGEVEDDFRYRARLTINNIASFEEVAYDDAVFDRVLDPEAIRFFLVPGAGGQTVENLSARKWVVDPIGAPSLLPSGAVRRRVGDDPIYDSRTVFRYLEQAVRSQRIRKFDENALDYRPKEDPFPKPRDGSDVTRYDFERTRVPKPSEGGGASQTVPTIANFRKLSVYVRNDRVIRIMEAVDVVDRLDTLKRNFELKLPEELSERQQAGVAIGAINDVRVALGEEPIRVRTMQFDLVDLGKPVAIKIPDKDVVLGQLSVVRGRGRQVRRDQGGDTPTTTSTTTPADDTTSAAAP